MSLSFNSNAFVNLNKTSIMHDDSKTETFKVYGNCGMCKKTIEGSLSSVEGVSSAIWNSDTKMLKVTFDAHEISLDEIKQKIAAVGYDTDKFRAPDKVYNGLMGCCQYERP
jgi:copper chaperone CopZ